MWKKIHCRYITKSIFEFVKLNHCLKLVKYSKLLQYKLDLQKKDYKEYSQIIIELIPEIEDSILSEKKNIFINFISEDEKKYYHIYFNDDLEKEIMLNYYSGTEKISKIKIFIDHNINSLKGLFSGCKIIKEISFFNFNRTNITDMSSMFQCCSSLTKINFNKFITNHVINMNYMFYRCTSLDELDLSNFDTKNVVNMTKMFFECKKLKKIIFASNFKINKKVDVSNMFCNCYYLNDIDCTNYDFRKDTDIINMFRGCSKKLIEKIKKRIKNIKNEALDNKSGYISKIEL